jgi:N-acetylmuramoyl-L-alanine amidase
VALSAIGAFAAAAVLGRYLAASSSRAGPSRSSSATVPAAEGPSESPSASPRDRSGVRRPDVVWKPIPFDSTRRRETAAYAQRHYGLRISRLNHPQVIVEHYTGGSSFASAWNTFASNQPDLGELPGTCAHFIVDTDGTVYQLVPLDTICRHTVGLNWTAIGIEDVGTSDRQVLNDAAQLSASLRLTVWLMVKFGIGLRNVIGHNESLTSPFHRELYPSWRCQTHQDWNHSDMQVYRAKLSALAAREGVRLAPGVRPVESNC